MIAKYNTKTDTWDNPLAHEMAKSGQIAFVKTEDCIEIWSSDVVDEINRVSNAVIRGALFGDKRKPHKFINRFHEQVLKSEKYKIAIGVYKWMVES